ncbi:MAG: HAD-IIB family hydrolase [Rhodobacteraceae bacterium]|nr:HAD-IIB family hydrolase [Paracoccaceae bacterium]
MRLLIFTDLDGTLLDHETYDFAPALPMLDRLAAMGVPVIAASSKTAAEIAGWQERLGLSRWPAIVENGAALADGAFDDAGYRRLRLAVAALGAPFRGFGDMTVQEVAEVTGLGPEAAALARKRAYSEPGIWRGTDAALERFLSALSARGISARRGGRFLTLSWGGSKAGRMAELVARLRPEVTVALGDAPNDAEMLAAADWAVVVRNEHGPGVAPLPDETRVIRTRAPGPNGWREGLEAVLDRLGIGGPDG